MPMSKGAAGRKGRNSTGTIRQLVDADFDKQLQRIEEATIDLAENNCESIIIGGSPLFTKMGHGSDIIPSSPARAGRPSETSSYWSAKSASRW